MKKLIMFCFFSIIFINTSVLANVVNNLKERMDKIESFHSKFIQKVTDRNGNVIQESWGSLRVKRPNLFNWHVVQPDEFFLISDGNTLWFYNPLINQVIATWLNDSIRNTPLAFFVHNRLDNWQQYNINQNGNNFTLIPKYKDSDLKKIIINIDNDGIFHRISTVEQHDQCNDYEFKLQKNSLIDKSKFTFLIPDGVTLDDQRQ